MLPPAGVGSRRALNDRALGRQAIETMRAKQKPDSFRAYRAAQLGQQPSELVQLIGELYQLSGENRRFLSARLGDPSKQLEEYRQVVADAMSPDLLRKGAKVRIAEAKQAITHYERATGDQAGTLDLMVTFVEQGTALAAEVGYGDQAFFLSLESMLSRALARFSKSPPEVVHAIAPRLLDLPEAARDIGWGYGDYVADAVAAALGRAR